MKYYFLIGLMLAYFKLFSQDEGGYSDKTQFVPFVGAIINAPYTSINVSGERSQLHGSLSPGFEVGLRYYLKLVNNFHISLGLGGGLNLMRNKIDVLADPHYSSESYDSGMNINLFEEIGVQFRTRAINNRLDISIGYRLYQVADAIINYGEIYTQMNTRFSSSVYINPNGELQHAFILRPEYLFAPFSNGKRLSLSLQFLVGLTDEDFINGSYFYETPNTFAQGEIEGGFINVALVFQIYL